MIYLLQSAAFDENNNLTTILKIGYTDNIVKRLETYKSHNPTIKLLYTIEGDKHVESLLHFKLGLYRFTMDEWYKNENYIIQGFSTSKTTGELLDYFGIDIESYQKLTYIELRKNTIEMLNKIIVPLNNIIASGYNFYNSANIYDSISSDIKKGLGLYEALENKYLASKDSIQEEIVRYNTNLESLADNIKSIVDRVNPNTIGRFNEKMKLICENDLTQEEQTLLISSIAPTFRNFYTVLGPERCKALEYIKGYLQKEYDRLVTDTTDEISSVIYSMFKENESYTFVYIKGVLKEIYTEHEYKKAPKASDILNYFDAVELKITNKETGKRDHCYKLIMKKK